jgi:hypothetical protein
VGYALERVEEVEVRVVELEYSFVNVVGSKVFWMLNKRRVVMVEKGVQQLPLSPKLSSMIYTSYRDGPASATTVELHIDQYRQVLQIAKLSECCTLGISYCEPELV